MNKKFIRVLGLGVGLFLAGSLSVNAQKVSFNGERLSLKQAFEKIESVSKYKIAYNTSQLDVNKQVVLNQKNQDVLQILSDLLKGTNCVYQVNDNYIVITLKDDEKVKKIKGTIKDSAGEPIIGANVILKGDATVGSITDIDGNFDLSVPSNATLQVSYIGYNTQDVSVGNKSFLNITLKEDTETLDEVVVVGYGSQKKVNVIGSIASVDSKALESRAVPDVSNMLTGQMSGVTITQESGNPGQDAGTIRIRGVGSFGATPSPLVLVDGLPGSLSDLTPADIDNISVLKDASSAAIYGSRAANGVVLITTKSGAEGKAKVQLSANLSISNPVKRIDVLDACDYALYRNERITNGLLYDGYSEADSQLEYPLVGYWAPVKAPDPITGEMVVVGQEYKPSPWDYRKGFVEKEGGPVRYGTNWQDEIFQTAISQDYNVTVSGGDKKGNYMYSGGYTDQQGVIVNSYYRRYTARANNSRKINDFLELGTNISFATSDNRLARTNSETYGVIPAAISFNPTRPVFDPNKDSGFSEDFSTGLANPYLTVHTEKNIQETLNVFISSFGELKFTDWLKFRQNFGYGYSYYERNTYNNRWTGAGIAPTNGYATKSDDAYESISTESLLTFNKKFGVHGINAVLGMTYENSMWHSKWMAASNFPNDMTEDNVIEAGTKDRRMESSRGKSQLMSYLFRANYNLLDRYLFTFSMRRDGSSKLSELNRWNNFYSGAVAWRLSDESFVKQLNFFDDLKLRVSAGQTGGQGVSAYATRSRFVVSNYGMGGSLQSGMAESRWGGPAAALLKWETTNQFDIGLDIAFLNNRVNLTVDAYYKKTKDLLLDKLIPMSSGFSRIQANYGNVTNKGLEISGHFIPVKARNFLWSIDANISFNRNKVGGLDADQYSDVAWGIENMFLVRNGEPIGTLYGYVEDGFYDNEAEVRADPLYRNETDSKVKSMVGEVKYKNLDDDPVIDNRDRQIIGNTNPDYQYGITNTLEWKNWTFSFFLQGTQGNDVLNVNLKKFDMASVDNMPYFIYNNRWTAENRANAKWPRANRTSTRSMRASDRYIEDGSYLRCKNVSLSYRFRHPMKFVESINLVASVSNLFTISGYSWMDPDVNSFGSDPKRRGVDMASYPSARTFNFGVQIGF